MWYNIYNMPSWNIHLEAGERLARKLHFNKKEKREFLLGCILPDINNGYVNKPEVVKEHHETHYAYNQKSSLNFYAENREKVNARVPVYLGYLFHLYTDGFFNYDFYRTIKRHPLGDGKTHEEKREIKHHDFWLFDRNFHHHIGVDDEKTAKELAREASKIKTVQIFANDVMEVEKILKDDVLNNHLDGEKFWFYSDERLEEVLEDMIESFTNDYLKERQDA